MVIEVMMWFEVLSPKSKYSGLVEVCAICVPYI